MGIGASRTSWRPPPRRADVLAARVFLSTLAAFLVGGLVLIRSLSLVDNRPSSSRESPWPFYGWPVITAWLTALFAAGTAGLVVWSALAWALE